MVMLLHSEVKKFVENVDKITDLWRLNLMKDLSVGYNAVYSVFVCITSELKWLIILLVKRRFKLICFYFIVI